MNKLNSIELTDRELYAPNKIREKLCAWMFEVSKLPYAFLFKRKKQAWKLSSTELMTYPPGSLGQKVGLFLKSNQFEMIDKLESHDVFHVLTGMKTSVKDEVGMQFLLFGNGKRSIYLFSTISICIFLLPEHFRYFIKCYKKGRLYHPIYKLELKEELNHQLSHIQWRLRKRTPKHVKLYGHLNNFS